MTELQFAEALARWMHRDQIDKSGRPYVEHLERVASMVSDEAKPAAWLHDILEDTDLGWPAVQNCCHINTSNAVWKLTRMQGVNYQRYIENFTRGKTIADRIAREVKWCDLKDNLSPSRRHTGDESLRERYERALSVLGGVVNG